MSSAFDCCLPCPPGSIPSANIVNIQGPQGEPGDPGADGADGADGGNAFCTTLANVLWPVTPGNNITVPCSDVRWMEVGQNVFMSGVEGFANFKVTSINTTTNFAVLEVLGYQGDLAAPPKISAGAGISPAGVQVQPVYPPTAYFVYKFETSAVAIALGALFGAGGVPHGLVGNPEILQAVLISQDGSEGGYASGDEVHAGSAFRWNGSTDEETGPAFGYGKNNLNVWATMNLDTNNASSSIKLPQKNSDTLFDPTLTNASKWKIKLTAVKLTAP